MKTRKENNIFYFLHKIKNSIKTFLQLNKNLLKYLHFYFCRRKESTKTSITKCCGRVRVVEVRVKLLEW